MDGRVLFAIVFGLVAAACGAFYIALSPQFDQPVTAPPVPVAAAPKLPTPGQNPAAPRLGQGFPLPAAGGPSAAPAASSDPVSAPPPAAAAPPPVSPTPVEATAASVEAEIAVSDFGQVQALLKANFPKEYEELLAFAVRHRNEGASDQRFGEDVFDRIQNILRDNLQLGVGASLATVDKLAANEKSLFHALGTDGASFCLRMLGKDDTPAGAQPPEDVRRLMTQGTLYRFQAIVEGKQNTRPVEALKADEMKAFETALNAEGLNVKEVNSGAYLNQAGGDPGKPCLTLEKLHRAIATLPDGPRRKIYASMFFVGR